jgi:eukaryotic translation initiation factor 2C
MGADVTHPGADGAMGHSIAAVVGSIDHRAFQYYTEIRLQKKCQERIEDMEDMVFNILQKFIKPAASSPMPKRIIPEKTGRCRREPVRRNFALGSVGN